MDTNDTIKEAVAVATASSKKINESGKKSSSHTTSSRVNKNKQKPRSRLGCIACKKSKIKCDEKQPKCTRCMKSGRECVYPTKLTALKPLENPPDETKQMQYYGVMEKYSDIPISEQDKAYLLKSNHIKSISFMKDLINSVSSSHSKYKNFDDVLKASQ